jgi:hypothetical protein
MLHANYYLNDQQTFLHLILICFNLTKHLTMYDINDCDQTRFDTMLNLHEEWMCSIYHKVTKDFTYIYLMSFLIINMTRSTNLVTTEIFHEHMDLCTNILKYYTLVI